MMTKLPARIRWYARMVEGEIRRAKRRGEWKWDTLTVLPEVPNFVGMKFKSNVTRNAHGDYSSDLTMAKLVDAVREFDK